MLNVEGSPHLFLIGEELKEETTSKLLEVVLEEKRREIIKEWIDSGRIEDINTK